METLKDNLHLLRSLRLLVETKNIEYYSHKIINEKEISDKTISIVMTSHERSQQVYFTLETIRRCNYKDIQVIIVDDSETDCIKEDKIKDFEYHIELISINRSRKYWANPCINYNIGFQYIKGGKVVIQNGEVCYIGDILSYINNNVSDGTYHVFDVKASKNLHCNDLIYNIYDKQNIDVSIYNEDIYQQWYQNSQHRNQCYHFLTALTKKTFDTIKGFSYDYSFGSCYDDDDLVLKIKTNNINIISINSEIMKIGGIHLFHNYTSNHNIHKNQQNENLFNKKKNYAIKTNSYLELSDYDEYNKLVEMYNLLNQ
jgi:hypothetical protein